MKWKIREYGFTGKLLNEEERESDETCFQRAAEDIAQQFDDAMAEGPTESRSFEMWCPLKGDWRKVTVDAEVDVTYSAYAEPLPDKPAHPPSDREGGRE